MSGWVHCPKCRVEMRIHGVVGVLKVRCPLCGKIYRVRPPKSR